MPTYEYACTTCGHQLEAVQKFSDDPLTECPECGGALRKVYGAVGIVLKGSGFYKTDSRAAARGNGNGNGNGNGSGTSKEKEKESSSSSSSESSTKESKDSSSKSDSGSGGSKDSKPAAATAS
ncbi:MAG TPA: FmdB family zinc ribbon protein [Acidimicrobiales bacterium]